LCKTFQVDPRLCIQVGEGGEKIKALVLRLAFRRKQKPFILSNLSHLEKPPSIQCYFLKKEVRNRSALSPPAKLRIFIAHLSLATMAHHLFYDCVIPATSGREHPTRSATPGLCS